MRYLLVSLLLCIVISGNSQNTYKGIIIDENTAQAVSFANVYLSNKTAGTYSNFDGEFFLEAEETDTIVISMLGYETTFLAISKLSNKKISIKPLTYELGEVTIKAPKNKKLKKVHLGYGKQRTTTTLTSHTRSQCVVYIPNELKTEAIINELILNLRTKGKDKPVFKIHIYSVDAVTGLPGIDLLKKDLTKDIVTSKNIKKINVRENNIFLPKHGVFVGFEYVGFLSENNVFQKDINGVELSFPITVKLKESATYFKSAYYKNVWKQTSAKDPLSILLNDNIAKTPVNACFGITVITYK